MSAAAFKSARAARGLIASRQLSRALATESVASSSSPPESSPASNAPRVRPGTPSAVHFRKSRNCVYVRSWDAINSMPEFFAMLRGVEKRFGRVREFRLNRVSVPV